MPGSQEVPILKRTPDDEAVFNSYKLVLIALNLLKKGHVMSCHVRFERQAQTDIWIQATLVSQNVQ